MLATCIVIFNSAHCAVLRSCSLDAAAVLTAHAPSMPIPSKRGFTAQRRFLVCLRRWASRQARRRHGSFVQRVLLSLLILLACLAAAPAYAGCSSPTGNEADRIYNQTSHTWQFCDGANWMSFGNGGATRRGGGCSSPTGNEADQIYNQGYHIWQFCNGTNWVTFSKTLVSGGGGSGCSNPTGNEADQIYNQSVSHLAVLQWHEMGRDDGSSLLLSWPRRHHFRCNRMVRAASLQRRRGGDRHTKGNQYPPRIG